MSLIARYNGQSVFGNACNTVASPAKNFSAFATPLQVSRKTFWRLQHRCKSHEKLSGVCNTVASPTKNFLAFATVLQVPRKTFWRLQHRCKSREKLSGVCNTVASLTKNFSAFATPLQIEKVSARLRYAGRWPRYRSAVRRAYPDGSLRCTAPCEGSGNASGGGR